MPFTQKYRPKNLKEFVDHKEAVDTFIKWMTGWKPGAKALLFYGMPGTGKTSLLHAWAAESNSDFIELNASDWRSASQIDEVLGQSMKQMPLFKKSKIFLIDEIDGIAGRQDLGGVGAIIKIIKESKFPVVLTANDPWSQKLRSLRSYCTLVEFGKVHVFDIERRLKEICEKEKINYDKEILRQIAKRSGGDLRSAINDLEAISQGKKEIAASDMEFLGFRERETNIFEVIRNVFKVQTGLAAKLSINSSDKDPEEIFWWIESNISKEYEKPEEIAKAYDALSKADIFRKRISSRQNWQFRSYMIDMMTAGVAVAKNDVYRKFTRYQYPTNIMVLGRTKGKRSAAGVVIGKLSEQLHCSSKKVRSDYLPFLKIILKNKSMRNRIGESFSLTKEDFSSLK
jgi:replication factor C large subunit